MVIPAFENGSKRTAAHPLMLFRSVLWNRHSYLTVA
jgi:hypothetical protein